VQLPTRYIGWTLVVLLIMIPFVSAESDELFLGQKGQNVSIMNGEITLSTEIFVDDTIHFFHATLYSGLTIYFFIVKDQKGNFRAAANACQLCYPAQEGFHQEKDLIICNVCGNSYPLNKIATGKGNCNPVPISEQLEVRDGKIILFQNDLENLMLFFKADQ